MTDDRLRSLERAHAADSSDVLARERLEAAWLRAGRGWHGERLPGNATGALLARAERGIYQWGVPDWGRPGFNLLADIEMVYVPGGEVVCERCGTRPYGECTSSGLCAFCFGSGRRTIAPFYLGRYPVTNGGALLWLHAVGTAIHLPAGDAYSHHPVVNVDQADALAFCAWAGLRLPSPEEWKWAALGGEAQRVLCDCKLGKPTWHKSSGSEPLGCVRCKAVGTLPRRFPWGNEPPSPERCVWAGTASGTHVAVSHAEVASVGRGPAPVVASDPPVPSRPLGASWGGAQDMAGNVWEWVSDGGVSDGVALGGSFRTEFGSSPFHNTRAAQAAQDINRRDDVGFRVALSIAGEA